jgi:hypothetical protein
MIPRNFKIIKEAFTRQIWSPVELFTTEQQELIKPVFIKFLKSSDTYKDLALTVRDENNAFMEKYKIRNIDVKNFVRTLSTADIEKVQGNSYSDNG